MVAQAANNARMAVNGSRVAGVGMNSAGVDPRSLTSKLKGRASARPQVGVVQNGTMAQPRGSKPDGMPLRLMAGVGAAGGAVMGAEFIGPAAGWGVRKTLGKLPGSTGKFFHDVAGAPRALINTLYDTSVQDVFKHRGQQFRANFAGNMYAYGAGNYGNLNARLNIVEETKNEVVKGAEDLIAGLKGEAKATGFGRITGKGVGALSNEELVAQLKELGDIKLLQRDATGNILKETNIWKDQLREVWPQAESLIKRLEGLGKKEKLPDREVTQLRRALAEKLPGLIEQARDITSPLGMAIESHAAQTAKVSGVSAFDPLAKEGSRVYALGKSKPEMPKGWSRLNPMAWLQYATEPAAIREVHNESKMGSVSRKFGEWEKGLGGGKAYEAHNIKGWSLDKIGQRMLKGRALTVGAKLGAVGALGYLGIKTTTGFMEQVSQAKEVYRDMYGKELSSWTLLMNPSSLPPMIQQLRHNMFEHTAPKSLEMVTESLDQYSGWDGFRGFRMAPMMAGFALSWGMGDFKPSGDFLGSYTQIKDTLGAGGKVSVDAYAQMIAAASLEARQAGGAESRLVQGLAKEYADVQMTPVAILKEVAEKKPFNARAQRVAKGIAVADQAAHKQPATDAPLLKDKAPNAKTVAPATALFAAGKGDPMRLASHMRHEGTVVQPTKELTNT